MRRRAPSGWSARLACGLLSLAGCSQPVVAPVPPGSSARVEDGGARGAVVLAETDPPLVASALRLSRDGRRLGVVGGRGQAVRIDLKAGTAVFSPAVTLAEAPPDPPEDFGVVGVALDPELDAVALVVDPSPRLVRNGTSTPLQLSSGYRPPVEGSTFNRFVLSADGALLFALHGHAEAQFTRAFDARTGAERASPLGHELRIPTLDRAGKRAVSAERWGDQRVYVRDLPAGKAREIGRAAAWTVTLSPDGSLVAFDAYEKLGRPDAETRVWDVGRGAERCKVRGYGPWFSPSGERFLVHTDEAVTLRRASDCAEISRFVGPLFGELPIELFHERLGAAWSPAGTVIVDLGRGGAPILTLALGRASLVGWAPDGTFEILGDRAEGLSSLRCDARGVRVAAGACAASAERPGLIARTLGG